MSKKPQIILATTLIAVLVGGVPLGLKWAKNREALAIQALPSRPPAKATRELRAALASCTEARVHLHIGENSSPELGRTMPSVNDELGKPAFVLRGPEMENLIASLHVEHDGTSIWHSSLGRVAVGAAFKVTALQFYAGKQWVADVRAHSTNLRWYTPLKYKGDASILPESQQYLQQVIDDHKQ